jgi:ribonuclease BN (tRNA processing enzyme)
MVKLTFLGTCGGRFATFYQTRATGGLYFEEDVKLHIDPGPGALIRLYENGIDPKETDAILVSHCHPDHYTDSEILIEAMTRGCFEKRGTLVGSESVLSGLEKIGPAISKHHQSVVAKVITAKPGDVISLDGLKVEVITTEHSDSTGVGFKIHTKHGIVTYGSDTDLNDQVIDAYSDSRLLILAATTPVSKKIPYHLTTDEAAKIIEKIKPEIAVLTHFGLRTLKEGAEYQAEWVEEKTGIRTLAALDGMIIEIEEKINVVEKENV